MNETIVVEDGQAAVATVAVSGTLMPESSATDIITTVQTNNGKQAAVVTTSVSGTLSPASSATDTIAIVDTPSGKQAAVKIYNMSGGGAPATKFGVSIDNLLGDVDENGVYAVPSGEFVFDGIGIKAIQESAMPYRFYGDSWTEVRLPDLVSIGSGGVPQSGQGACENAFSTPINYNTKHSFYMPNLETINGYYAASRMFSSAYLDGVAELPKLTTIIGSFAAGNMFQSNNITQVSLPRLTTIDGTKAAQYMFSNNNITSVDVSALATVSGSNACAQMFGGNPFLARVDFPALVSVEADSFGSSSITSIFASCTELLEIHFRADAQAVIEALTVYQNKLGATNATIYFDL